MKTQWTRQPQFPVGIDWNNQITRDLQVASIGTRTLWKKDTGYQRFGVTGTPKQRPDKPGLVTGFGSTWGTGSTDQITVGNLRIYKHRTAFAFVYKAGAGGGNLARVYDTTGSSNAELFYFDASHKLQYVRYATAQAAQITWTSGSALTLNKWSSVAVSHSEGSLSVDMYYDGASIGSPTSNYTGGAFSPYLNATFAIGNRATDNARNFDGMIGPLFIFDRALSAAEIKSLHDNPWQIFAPLKRRFPLLAGSPPQLLSPNGDVAGGTWLPSTGTDLFACIDESSADGADYIYTTVPGAYQEFYFPDGGAVDASSGGHVRYQLPAGTGTITAILKQGSTTLQTLGVHTLTGSVQNIDVTITASTANSTDLRVGFTAS